MKTHYKTQGFVFKQEDRLETDRVFSIFTLNFGRVEIFGKAIRKIASKLRGGIEMFSLSEIEFIQGEKKKTLTDAISIEKFKHIQQVPEKFEIAYTISNVVDSFIKGEQEDQVMFGLLRETFHKLNTASSHAQCLLIYFYFFWNFTSILGYGLELSRCAVCEGKLDPDTLYFSNKEGGVICKNCHIIKKDSLAITPDVIKVLRLLLKKDWEVILKLKFENTTKYSLQKISDEYYHYLVNYYVS